jgi:hypothetical protein
MSKILERVQLRVNCECLNSEILKRERERERERDRTDALTQAKEKTDGGSSLAESVIRNSLFSFRRLLTSVDFD